MRDVSGALRLRAALHTLCTAAFCLSALALFGTVQRGSVPTAAECLVRLTYMLMLQRNLATILHLHAMRTPRQSA